MAGDVVKSDVINQFRSGLPTAAELAEHAESESPREIGPLEGVAKHWYQAQQCFMALRQQFPDIRSTVRFMTTAVDYAERMEDYQKKMVERMMDGADPKVIAYLGVITNLMACAQLINPINAILPHPRNHYGYDNNAEIRRELIPALYGTDVVVQSLGLAVMTHDSPFLELAEAAANRARPHMPPSLSD